MKMIIVPTDFSSSSLNIINYAADMALAIKANLHLFHVYNETLTYTDIPVMLPTIKEVEQSVTKQLGTLKRNIEHITGDNVNITAESKLGDTVDELEALCKRVNPFAVIVANNNQSIVEKIFGLNTNIDIMKRLTCPVIYVPQGTEYATGIRKIGLAYDYEEEIDTIPYKTISGIVKQYKANLFIVNIGKSAEDFNASKVLQANAWQFMLENVSPKYDFVINDNIEDGITTYSELNNLDMMIMLPKHHNTLSNIFHIAHSKKMIFRTHIPIMFIHALANVS
jgi:nucleotide-binding universal stress UspA family protein